MLSSIYVLTRGFSLKHHFLKIHYSVSHLQLLVKLSLSLQNSLNKSCDLDPFPTLLIKSCINQLIFTITTNINLSTQGAVVPGDFKQALVNHFIKNKLCVHMTSRIIFLSPISVFCQVLRRVVTNRLHEHIYQHHLSNYQQSAYRFHSTETALLKIYNDIVDNMDNSKVTTLTLLDISAAFDTIDDLILLQHLNKHFGISDTVLRCFKSYFSDRHQRINISGTLSCPQHLPFGVPQGSILGPVLFSYVSVPSHNSHTNHNLSHHLYADDTHIYISLSKSNAQECFDFKLLSD